VNVLVNASVSLVANETALASKLKQVADLLYTFVPTTLHFMFIYIYIYIYIHIYLIVNEAFLHSTSCQNSAPVLVVEVLYGVHAK